MTRRGCDTERMMWISRLWTLAVLSLSSLGLASSFGCIGNDNKPVDWFVAYKIPEMRHNPNKLIEGGSAFIYLDDVMPSWKMSDKAINDSNQAIGYTLNQLYRGHTNDVSYLMYNDEPAEPQNRFPYNSKAHQKGVVSFDKKQGFWLVHSVPKFPPEFKSGFGYPHSGHRYGQMFLCISLNGSYFKEIAKQLLVSEPEIYDYRIAASSPYAKDPDIQKMVQGGHSTAMQRMAVLQSLKGQNFISYSKSRSWGLDLYTDWVAPNLKSGLYTETWLRQRKMPSNCSTSFKVENVQSVSLPDSIKFKETVDHAKWAVTNQKDGKTSACIGDINRMESQRERGGGTVCTSHTGLWKLFLHMVDKYEHCPAHGEGQREDHILRFKPEQI